VIVVYPPTWCRTLSRSYEYAVRNASGVFFKAKNVINAAFRIAILDTISCRSLIGNMRGPYQPIRFANGSKLEALSSIFVTVKAALIPR
jgi:hypothetical protein